MPTTVVGGVTACEWRTVDGVRFLYADYRGAQGATEMLAVLDEQLAMIEAEGHGVRLVIHVPGDHRPPAEFLGAVKQAMRYKMAQLGVRSAFVGISGFGRVVLRGLQLVGGGFGVLAFDSVEKAVVYLARP